MAYNFNPRERTKRQMKFDEYERLGIISWDMVPIGSIDEDRKFKTSCGPSYTQYNQCLKTTLFNKQQCQPKMTNVIECEKNNGLYETQKKLDILRNYKKNRAKASSQ